MLYEIYLLLKFTVPNNLIIIVKMMVLLTQALLILADLLATPLMPTGSLAPKDFDLFIFAIFRLSVSDEGYPRYVS